MYACAQIMELVELGSLAQALVGRPGSSGLSVEQRKRLTIAVELVANPSIVFMDEPTSGACAPIHHIRSPLVVGYRVAIACPCPASCSWTSPPAVRAHPSITLGPVLW